MKTREQIEAVAEYWDCRQSDRLSHQSLVECLSDYFDMMLDPGMTPEQVEQTIRDSCPVEVTCYVQNQWTESARDAYAEHVVEALFYRFDEDEDFAHPDDSIASLLSTDQEKAIKEKARALVDDFALRAPIYGCSDEGTFVVEEDEAVALMRAANASWFAIQQNSGQVTARAGGDVQVPDFGAAAQTRTGDLLITNQSELSPQSTQEQSLSEGQARAGAVEKGESDQGCGQTLQQGVATHG